MATAREKYFKQVELQAVDAFKDHKVVEYNLLDAFNLECLLWKKPLSGFYKILYIRSGGTLFVSGDCYEAVYQWSEPQTLVWMADTNFSYFHGKCRASAKGACPVTWDPAVAREWLEEAEKDGDFKDASFEDLEELKYDDICQSKESFMDWVYRANPDVACDVSNIGDLPDVMSYFHWYGLKQAMKWLEAHDGKVS